MQAEIAIVFNCPGYLPVTLYSTKGMWKIELQTAWKNIAI